MPVIDFEITANRPDCLSHVGIAREASAIWSLPLQLPDVHDAATRRPADSRSTSTIEDAELCPRYCAQVFDVTIGPSPALAAERLEAAGVRPINNIVDVTNYVMLEIGQPMHAFDLDAARRTRARRPPRARRRAAAHARRRRARRSTPDMLVIADADARRGGRRRDGRRRLGDRRRHDARSCSRARTSTRRRCAARASGSG